jgi:hypothetical protein
MTEKDNAFRRIFEVVDQPESEVPSIPMTSPQPSSELEPSLETEAESPKRGRPRGKKSDPEFISAIAYIKKKTHLQVKRLLLDKEEQGAKQDFSELVQELLEFWVQLQQGEEPETLIARFSDSQKSKD